MRYRKLSSTGDYVFGNQQADFYKDTPEAVAQAVKTRFLLWLGEWFLNVNEGTPYMQGILGKHSKQEADLTYQDVILNTTGVTSFENYVSAIEPSSRKYSASFTLNTIYGPTQVEINNYANY